MGRRRVIHAEAGNKAASGREMPVHGWQTL
jgi:hypothetical protein